eukprot:356533-Chlamydomonas_euryale.AAC.2
MNSGLDPGPSSRSGLTRVAAQAASVCLARVVDHGIDAVNTLADDGRRVDAVADIGRRSREGKVLSLPRTHAVDASRGGAADRHGVGVVGAAGRRECVTWVPRHSSLLAGLGSVPALLGWSVSQPGWATVAMQQRLGGHIGKNERKRSHTKGPNTGARQACIGSPDTLNPS